MDEDIIESVELSLIHLAETSEADWSAEDDAKFLIGCLISFGYDITPGTNMVLN